MVNERAFERAPCGKSASTRRQIPVQIGDKTATAVTAKMQVTINPLTPPETKPSAVAPSPCAQSRLAF
jgi:hypothetical protein